MSVWKGYNSLRGQSHGQTRASPSERVRDVTVGISLIQSFLHSQPVRHTVQASPLLVRNVTRSFGRLPLLALYPSPYGSARPTAPVAQTVTVARLASPTSVDRSFQVAYMRNLHAYFQQRARLMKQGDLLSVPVDTDAMHVGQSDGAAEIGDLHLESPR